MSKTPKEWEPRIVDLKSGWKNNANILAEIVTFMNEEDYIEDESEMMERVDMVLEWIKSKYKITKK